MKSALLLSVLVIAFNSSPSSANAIFSGISHYMNTKTGAVTEISDNDAAKENLSDLSRETKNEIAGVSAGELILVNSRACQVYYLFENGSARIGCQTGKITANIGVSRAEVAQFNLASVETAGVVAEVSSLDGVNKKDRGELLIKSGNLNAGTKIKVEAIFANGEALVQKISAFNAIDSSGILMKLDIEKVKLSDLKID